MMKWFSKFFKKERKEEKPIQEELKQPKVKTVEDYVEDFKTAIQNKDGDAAKTSLRKAIEVCPQRNSYCGDEIFCPECPFGGLVVKSGRAGL